MITPLFSTEILTLIFAGLMALSMLMYVVLDGYDLGVGMLMPFTQSQNERDTMVSSIGPFWDANETWLVLGIGLLLIAFPKAYGIILGELYLPVALMLMGLILRGCAFDFRVKAKDRHQKMWDKLFIGGSYVATLMQGIMIGRYITGFAPGVIPWFFALLTSVGLCFAYALLGAAWLLMKTETELQVKAIKWIKGSVLMAAAVIFLVSIATPLASESVVEKWFVLPNFIWLIFLPVSCVALFAFIFWYLSHFSVQTHDRGCWIPFLCSISIVLSAFIGLGYSIYPYVILDQLTLQEAASDPEALTFVLWGTMFVLPAILGYTLFIHYIFRGKTTELHYD